MIPGFIDAPPRWVVYLLYNAGELVYVGQSGAYQERLRAHRSRFDFDRVMIKYCETEEETLRLEADIIIIRKPRYNMTLRRRYCLDKLPKIDLKEIGLL